MIGFNFKASTAKDYTERMIKEQISKILEELKPNIEKACKDCKFQTEFEVDPAIFEYVRFELIACGYRVCAVKSGDKTTVTLYWS